MPEDFDIPDIPDVDEAAAGDPSGGGGERKARRRWPWLAAGLALGVAGALVLPGVLGPYLPDSLRPDRLRIGGEVLKKRADAERLQLTVETDSGAMLATFRQRISAIDLLVEPGDSITLVLDRYQPFVEDPGLQGVRKGRAPAESGDAPGSPSDASDGEPAAGAAEREGDTLDRARPGAGADSPTSVDTAGAADER